MAKSNEKIKSSDKINNNLVASTILAVLVTAVVGGFGGYMLGQRIGESTSPMASQVVASVDGNQITQSQLYDRMLKDSGLQTLDGMITESLVRAEAAKANITVSQDEIDKEIKRIQESMGGEEAFNQALASQNMTMDQLKEYTTLNVMVTKLLTRDMQLDDAALQAYFQANESQYDKRQVHARHILVNTEEEAKAIKAELDKGADFAALADKKSIDTSAKGGDLGLFGRGDMAAEFEQAAFSMKVNEISQPVKTSYGWHVIQVLEVQGSAPTFAAVKDQVRDAMIQEQVQSQAQVWVESLKAKAKITNTLEPKK